MGKGRFTLKLDFEIKAVDQPAYSRPPYGIDNNLTRFDEREAAFYSSRFTDEISYFLDGLFHFLNDRKSFHLLDVLE